MRLPWPFRREQTGSRRPRRRASGAVSAASPAPIPVRPPLDEWQGVSPIEGLSEPLELTADGHFGRSLAAEQALPPVLQDVAADGGIEPLVRSHGLADTLPSAPAPAPSRRGPELAYRPRPQRAPAGLGAEGVADIDEAAPTTPAASGSPAPETEASRATALPPVSVPDRLVATSTNGPGPNAPPRPTPLTVVPATQRGQIEQAAHTAGLLLAEPPAPRPRREAPVEPVGEGLERPPASDAVADGPSAATPSMDMSSSLPNDLAPRRRPNLGESRRAGLGPPLPSAQLPAETRDTNAGQAPAQMPASGGEPVTATPLETAPMGPTTTGPDLSAAAVPEPATPGAGGSARGRHKPDLVHRYETPMTERVVDPMARSVTPAGNEPISLQPSLTIPQSVRRAPSGGPVNAPPRPQAAARTETVATPEGPVEVDRSEQGAEAARSIDADAYTAGDTIVIPPQHGPLDEGRGRQLLAHELVHVRQQRTLGSDLPPEESGAGRSLEREARVAESATASPSPTVAPLAELPLARGPASRRADVSADADTTSPATAVAEVAELMRTAEAVAGAGPAGAQEAAPEISLPTAGGGDAVTQRAVTSDADAGTEATDGAGDETDLDEMARQLYERIRLRLRRELLLDRERGGYLTDTR